MMAMLLPGVIRIVVHCNAIFSAISPCTIRLKVLSGTSKLDKYSQSFQVINIPLTERQRLKDDHL